MITKHTLIERYKTGFKKKRENNLVKRIKSPFKA